MESSVDYALLHADLNFDGMISWEEYVWGVKRTNDATMAAAAATVKAAQINLNVDNTLGGATN